MPRKPATIGQLGIEGLGLPARNFELNDTKIAFGRVLMPSFFQLDELSHESIPDSVAEYASPEHFYPHLFPGGFRGRFAVDGVAMSAADYIILPRSVSSLMATIANNTERKYALGSENLQRAQAKQKQMDDLSKRLEKMQQRTPVIETNIERIERLDKEAKATGYAHVPGIKLFGMAFSVWSGTFRQILEVVGREKSWTREKSELAMRSLNKRLFFMEQKDKIANWRGMNELGIEYESRVLGVYNDRIAATSRALDRLRSAD